MTRYLLHHRHTPDECGVVSTSFKGHQSPLRHAPGSSTSAAPRWSNGGVICDRSGTGYDVANEQEGVVAVHERDGSSTALSAGDRAGLEDLLRPADGGPHPAAGVPSRRSVLRPWRWTAGRITALVTGALLVLVSLGLLGAGGTALWADRTQRDAAGYVTTKVHGFSAPGSALVTERVQLDAPGAGWLYSSTVLGKLRIRITPVHAGSPLFVGIGPSADVDRYLAGVSHTLISDFWSDRAQPITGGIPGSPPGAQDFWIASATGSGAQTLTWDPANGSWTVVVMHADGRAGIDVGTDLAATYPALLRTAIGLLVAGGVFLLGGVLLIVGAIRQSRASGTRTL